MANHKSANKNKQKQQKKHYQRRTQKQSQNFCKKSHCGGSVR